MRLSRPTINNATDAAISRVIGGGFIVAAIMLTTAAVLGVL